MEIVEAVQIAMMIRDQKKAPADPKRLAGAMYALMKAYKKAQRPSIKEAYKRHGIIIMNETKARGMEIRVNGQPVHWQ
jgi:hypothetical protein